ncbi:MAG: SpoVG family protein [Candidatus Omnitrophota bacterium]
MNEGLKFKVTRLHRIDGEGNLRAFVDVAFNESLLLKGLRIVEGKNGLFVSMPREKGRDNRWYEMVHPLSKQVKDEISSIILSAYQSE